MRKHEFMESFHARLIPTHLRFDTASMPAISFGLPSLPPSRFTSTRFSCETIKLCKLIRKSRRTQCVQVCSRELPDVSPGIRIKSQLKFVRKQKCFIDFI